MKESNIKAMRVLHIIPGYGGGISSHVRNLVNGIDSSKVIIDVAGFTDYPENFKNEVHEKQGMTYNLRNVRIRSIGHCLAEIHTILKNGNYDAVHLHLTDVQACYFSIIARIHGIKRIIVHAHIADEKGSNRFGFKIKKKIDQFLTDIAATDYASCSKLASSFRFGEKKIDNVMHIPNSIDENLYFKDEYDVKDIKYYEEFDVDKSQLIIGHVGFFGYQKNHLFMFEIAKRLIERNVKFIWLFIGTGYNFEDYKNIAKEMGIDKYVRFLGRREDVCDIYKMMNVFVLPSFFEGLPTVAIEAQASGTPCVLADTISEETDLGLGLVHRLSLNKSVDEWCDEIIKMSKITIPNNIERKNVIEKKYFTRKTAANLYTDFIYKKIHTHNL